MYSHSYLNECGAETFIHGSLAPIYSVKVLLVV
ncbi:Uncharacterised protein [Vibrio cholerae]|nr:Uncharacterised protein [Vibrio cholerae]